MAGQTVGLKGKLLLITAGHRRLFRNPSFVLLWSGQTVSVFGDAFFNLAVMWVVWSETQSTLQTAIIQAIWHLPDVIFAPLAGVLADRWDRKTIMVTTSLAAAAVVAAVALLVALIGHLPPIIAFIAIFKLNSLTAFMSPARASVMPSVVGARPVDHCPGLILHRQRDGVSGWQRGCGAVDRGCKRGVGLGSRCCIVPVRGAVYRARPPAGPG